MTLTIKCRDCQRHPRKTQEADIQKGLLTIIKDRLKKNEKFMKNETKFTSPCPVCLVPVSLLCTHPDKSPVIPIRTLRILVVPFLFLEG